MKCPHCLHLRSVVNETRSADGGRATYRRRKCSACGESFVSIERTEDGMRMPVEINKASMARLNAYKAKQKQRRI